MTAKKGWFLGHLRHKLKTLLKLHEKKSNNWPTLSFIHNEREVITWMGYKLQNLKHKIQSNIFKINIFFEFQAADH